MDELIEVVKRLRAPDGCPWDKEQTHESLKAGIIEEAAEVIGGINIYSQTGNPENLKEELGDLLLQVVMQAQIAEEEGKEDANMYLPEAFNEAQELIDKARVRKGYV